MNTRFIAYQQLGLISDADNSLLDSQFVDYPTGDLDVDRLFDGYQDCFVEPYIASSKKKKKIILADWSVRYHIKDAKVTLDYIQQLISDGFEVYFWIGKLVKIDSEHPAAEYIRYIEPIHREHLAKKLPDYHLARDECYLSDYCRTQYASEVIRVKGWHEAHNIRISMLNKLPVLEAKRILKAIADSDEMMVILDEEISDALIESITDFLSTHHRLELYKYKPQPALLLANFWKKLDYLKVEKSDMTYDAFANILSQTPMLTRLSAVFEVTHPKLLLAVNLIVYLPCLEKIWLGSFKIDFAPSPKSHNQLTILPLEIKVES